MNSKQTSRVCGRCGTAVAPDAPQGLCPACILERYCEPKPPEPKISASPDARSSALPSDIASERPGTIIGRYRLLEQIGEGGFGVVYMAEQIEPVRRKVALKIIKAGMDTREVIARFEAERQALALMDHPNIAHVLDGGTTSEGRVHPPSPRLWRTGNASAVAEAMADRECRSEDSQSAISNLQSAFGLGRPYFVMELVQGIPITEFSDKHNLNMKERLSLFIQVCKAVQHAHQKGIIHRDLKPSNILVTHQQSEPVPKIIDFGVAKALGRKLTEKTLFTGFLRMVGTPAYMSPEQAEFTGMDIDTRSDIYSLGVLLYELLTGLTPFDPETIQKAALDELRRMIRETEPPKPSTRLQTLGERLTEVARHRHTEPPRLIHSVRGDLDWIVMKCLEKDRRRRYETANGLAMDVQRHLSHEPIVARPPSKLYELQKTVRRHKFGFAAAASLILVLAIGVLISTREAIRAARAEQEQVRLREQAEQAEAREALLRHEAQARELASRRQAYVSDVGAACAALDHGNLGVARELLNHHLPEPGQADLRGFEWRYLWGLSRGEQTRTLFGHSNYVVCVAYSPDGTLLASGGADHNVRIWDARSGQSIAVCAGHSQTVLSVAFSPDGKLLASGGEDGLVQFWEVGEWQVVFTITNPAPHLAFAGRLLAIGSGGNKYGRDGGRVTVWDYVARQRVASLPQSGNRAAFSPDGQTLATANWDGLVKLWDVHTRQERQAVASESVVSMVFSPDGRWLAWCGGQRTAHLWDLQEDQPAVLEQGTGRKVHCVAFSPDSKILATANESHDILLWDVVHRQRLRALRGHGREVHSIAFSPDGKQLASASWDETVMLWSLEPRRAKSNIADVRFEPWHSVGRPVFSPNGGLLAAASSSEGLQLWDVASCEVVARLATDHLPMAFSLDGRGLLAVDRESNLLQEWDIVTQTLQGKVRLNPITHHRYWYADAFSPSAHLIASAHQDEVILRSSMTGEVTIKLTHLSPTRSVAFSSHGDLLSTGHWEGTAKLWDSTTGDLVFQADGFRDAVSCFAFTPNDNLLAVGSWDSSIRIFDLSTKQKLRTLTGHWAGVSRIAISSDGKTLASSASEGVRLWNLATGREILMLSRDLAGAHPVRDLGGLGEGAHMVLKFSPDGRTLLTGPELWRAPSFDEIASAEMPEDHRGR